VQSIYRVSEGAGLALTTARYYTPSGRLIQRPWDGTFDEYLTYTLRDQDADRPHEAKDLKHTDSGRKVYAGGGIEPDIRLEGPIEGFDPSRFGRRLYARQMFGTFAQRFSAAGDNRFESNGKGRYVVSPDFEVDDQLVSDFKAHVIKSGMTIDEQAFTADLPFIKAMIRYDIDLALFGVASARRHLIALDPQAQLALRSFDEAERLTAAGRAPRRAER